MNAQENIKGRAIKECVKTVDRACLVWYLVFVLKKKQTKFLVQVC